MMTSIWVPCAKMRLNFHISDRGDCLTGISDFFLLGKNLAKKISGLEYPLIFDKYLINS